MRSFEDLTDEERELVEERELQIKEEFEEKLRENLCFNDSIDLEMEEIESSRNSTFYENALPKLLEEFEQKEHSRLSAFIEDKDKLETILSESIKAEEKRLIAFFDNGGILPAITREEITEDYIKKELEKAEENEKFFDEAMNELFDVETE